MKCLCLLIASGIFGALASAPAHAQRVTIVSESKSGDLWVQAPGTPRVVAGYPTNVADQSLDVCVSIGYRINKDGSTSSFSQLKAWSSRTPGVEPKPELVQPFVQSAAAAVSMWRLVPRSGKAKSIYTAATFAFDGSKTVDAGKISAYCRIDDLPWFVAEAQKDNRRGNLRNRERDPQRSNPEAPSQPYIR